MTVGYSVREVKLSVVRHCFDKDVEKGDDERLSQIFPCYYVEDYK